MKITIIIDTDTEAFKVKGHQDNGSTHFELIKVLAPFHTRVRTLGLKKCDGIKLLDSNGTTVGKVEVTD